MRLSRLAVPLSFVLAAVGLPAGSPAVAAPAGAGQFVLSPEGNHLWAYDAATGAAQLVNLAQNGSGDPGVAPPKGSSKRDINGQVCVTPDQRHVITGEDTVIGSGGSHDPRIAGWGYFAISGSRLGEIRIRQVGKLAPEAGTGPGYTGDPDNFGCGFLDGRRLVTTAIGNTLPGEPANGQLFLWFGPFDRRFRSEKTEDKTTTFFVGEVPHCELDHTLATAGGIAVDPKNGDVYVAANRPTEIPGGDPGGIWRFSGRFPKTPKECTRAYLDRHVRKELVIPIEPQLPADPTAPTPSAVVVSPDDTLYVSSVFSGTVSEFSKDGVWMRDLYPLSPVAPRTGPTTQTPFGLAITRDGALWIADLGIALAAPAPGQGSVIRVPLGDAVAVPETVKDGLTFPDGLGVYSPRAGASRRGAATSQWPCGNWGMYGRTLSREFSTDCPSGISPETVSALQPAWTFRVPPAPGDQTTFTATPAVVEGVVYVGSWNGKFYALNLEDGSVIWEHETIPAVGATFGPIVSSAAVADVRGRRTVFFGAGPRLYALDAADGREVWTRHFGKLPRGEADPAEVESSPVVWKDTVYVGMDVHNQRGDETGNNRGGVFALNAASGAIKWEYHPERTARQPASGCGGVWGSPTIDAGTGLLYFGTANCPAVNDNPKLPMEEITALRAATGTRVWTFRPHQPAGEEAYDDQDEDFGATPNLFRDTTGRKVLGAGSKDGSYYALDPRNGKVLWNTSVTSPAPGVGGFIGSPAVLDGNVFGGVAIGSPTWYHSLDGATGELRWRGAAGPSYAASAGVNGVVFSGALDFTVKAFDAATGNVLWVSPALGAVSSGPAIVGDWVLIGSGTSTSDACAKDLPASDVCVAFFDAALSQQGGLHAYRLPALP